MKPLPLAVGVVVLVFGLAVGSCGVTDAPPPELPEVHAVDPTSGPTSGGTVVTVMGRNFRSSVTVTFGGAPAPVTVESSTLAHVTTPAHSEGTVDVTVTAPGGESATASNAFTFVGPPKLTSIAPDFGSNAGGTLVTIIGSAFQNGATVSIGGAAAPGVSTKSSTSISATTPAGAAGAVDVVVTNPDTQTGTLEGGFTYVPPPTVTSVAPTSGFPAGGTAVTITGTDFVSGATVTLGGTAATGVTFNSSTSLSATTPAGVLGAVDVVVTNPDTQTGTLAGGFTYVPPPTVTSVAPTSGTTLGGAAVTISGTNFIDGATVTFGGTAATGVTVNSSTSITATTPVHTAGAADVVVTNADTQIGTLAGGFTYVPPPTVTSVAPSSGPTAGGTVVTLTGTNLIDGATVTFGGTAATGVTVNSSTSITATTPAHTAGAADVVVTNPDTQIGALAGGFTFVTERWPDFSPTTEQIEVLDYKYDGIYGSFHNTEHEVLSQPYDPAGNYLNWASKGCPHTARKVDYLGQLYFNPTTSSQDALRCHGQFVMGREPSEYFFVHADLLVELQSEDGGFQYPIRVQHEEYGSLEPGWVSAMTQGQALSVFARAYALTGDSGYLDAGAKAFANMQTPVNNGGTRASLADLDPSLSGYVFFPEWLYDPIPITLNGYIFTLLGIYDWSLVVSPSQWNARFDFEAGIKTLERILRYFDFNGYTAYDLGHLVYGLEPNVQPQYMTVHVYLLHALNSIVSNPTLQYYERVWAEKLDELNADLRITEVNFSHPTPQPAGIPVTVKISAEGGTDAEKLYEFQVKFEGEWTTKQPFSSDDTFEWMPMKPGQYDLGLFVKNEGSSQGFDNFRAIRFVITAAQ